MSDAGLAIRLRGWTDLARLGALFAFGLVVWRIAIHAMTGKLID